MYSQPIQFSHEWILCIQIIRGRVDFNGHSTSKKSLQAPSFEPATFQPMSSICSRSFLKDLAIFMATTWSDPFKWHTIWGTTLQWSLSIYPEHSPDFPRACIRQVSLFSSLEVTDNSQGELDLSPSEPRLVSMSQWT